MPGQGVQQAVHTRLYRSRGYAREHSCVGCGRQALDWAYQYSAGPDELVSPTGRRYSNSMDDYAPMCRKCHMTFDREKDLEMAERVRESARSVPREVRVAAGEASARRLREDPEFAAEMKVLRDRSARMGGAATAKKFREDPEYHLIHADRLRKAALKRYTCTECGYTNNAGTVARHQKKLGHEGREGS